MHIFVKKNKERYKISYHIKKLKYQNPEYFFVFKKHKDGYNIWRIDTKL